MIIVARVLSSPHNGFGVFAVQLGLWAVSACIRGMRHRDFNQATDTSSGQLRAAANRVLSDSDARSPKLALLARSDALLSAAGKARVASVALTIMCELAYEHVSSAQVAEQMLCVTFLCELLTYGFAPLVHIFYRLLAVDVSQSSLVSHNNRQV
jgi:hypothetical protein